MPLFSDNSLSDTPESAPAPTGKGSGYSMPEPVPTNVEKKCPHCGEVNEVYGFIIDKIKSAPEPGIPSVEVLSISPRDPNPDPYARSHYWQKVWSCREARYRATHRLVK